MKFLPDFYWLARRVVAGLFAWLLVGCLDGGMVSWMLMNWLDGVRVWGEARRFPRGGDLLSDPNSSSLGLETLSAGGNVDLQMLHPSFLPPPSRACKADQDGSSSHHQLQMAQ